MSTTPSWTSEQTAVRLHLEFVEAELIALLTDTVGEDRPLVSQLRVATRMVRGARAALAPEDVQPGR